MRARNIHGIAFVSVMVIAQLVNIAGGPFTFAQQPKRHIKTSFGPYDSVLSYPASTLTIGRKDPSALSEIRQSLTSSSVPEHAGIEVRGVLTSGSGSNQREYPASFVIENGGYFRLDIQKEDAMRSFRIAGSSAKVQQGNESVKGLGAADFGDPLGVPSSLYEFATRKDAIVVDDGEVLVDDHSLRKITITLLRPHADPVSASFYFDNETHLLRKSVFVNHSTTSEALMYLKVVTYDDYHKDQSVLLPHKYSETVNGQLIMTFTANSVAITSPHGDAYFSF